MLKILQKSKQNNQNNKPMKRLQLDDFKSKHIKVNQTSEVDQLLGQVLGDCHDDEGTGDDEPAVWTIIKKIGSIIIR